MNCIRCGRRIAEGKTFCDECAGVVREPLPDSPYTSLHIALPKRTDQPRPARKLCTLDGNCAAMPKAPSQRELSKPIGFN